MYIPSISPDDNLYEHINIDNKMLIANYCIFLMSMFIKLLLSCKVAYQCVDILKATFGLYFNYDPIQIHKNK